MQFLAKANSLRKAVAAAAKTIGLTMLKKPVVFEQKLKRREEYVQKKPKEVLGGGRAVRGCPW